MVQKNINYSVSLHAIPNELMIFKYYTYAIVLLSFKHFTNNILYKNNRRNQET